LGNGCEGACKPVGTEPALSGKHVNNAHLKPQIKEKKMVKMKKTLAVFSIFALLMLFSLNVYAQEKGKVNINTATVKELVQLKGVGNQYAQKIVEYRETKGSFEKPEDIKNVQGIGEKTWEMNKGLIVIE
jgi:competence protein ComEA